MSTPSPASENTADREIVISRVFHAPRELVWQAMTDPQHVVNWWGPRGFRTTIERMDLRPGGVWQQVMHGPDGTNYPNKSTFREIVKPERIVYTHAGGRENGPGTSFEATWTFEVVEGNRTRLTLRQVFASPEDRDFIVREFGAIEGGKQTLTRLSEHLAAKVTRPFLITREFAAPRPLVWQAWTERDRLLRWFGPKGFTMTSATMDFRVGGMYHYGLRTPDGKDFWGKFVYREIVPHDKIVWVNSFSDAQGGTTRHPFTTAAWPLELLTEVTFQETAGRTTVTVLWVPLDATEEERAAFEGGRESMKMGWTGTMEQLTEYIAAQG